MGFPELLMLRLPGPPLEPLGSQICWARGEVLMFLKSLRLWWDMMGSYEGVQFMGLRLNHPFPRMFRYKRTFWGFPSLGNPHIQSIRYIVLHIVVGMFWWSIQHIGCLPTISSKTFTNVQAALLMSLGNKPACARVWLGRGLNEAMNHRISPCFWPPDMVQ